MWRIALYSHTARLCTRCNGSITWSRVTARAKRIGLNTEGSDERAVKGLSVDVIVTGLDDKEAALLLMHKKRDRVELYRSRSGNDK